MKIAEYTNGNTTVTIMSDGTKFREYEGFADIIHPESIDIKITDYCDMACSYCHESSTTNGIHGDLPMLLDVISVLPPGVELAIGGGNPLSHPELISFLRTLKERGIIANITINQGHIKTHYNTIEYMIAENLVKGIGISITSNNFKYVGAIKALSENVVYHLIAGINTPEQLDSLIDLGGCKALLLGYKAFGFGESYFNDHVNSGIRFWRKSLPKYISKCTISFDNLAIEQLNVKKLFTHAGWDKFYMGDDFCFTMYIDAVKQEYAPTSRSKQRVHFSKSSLLDYFKKTTP